MKSSLYVGAGIVVVAAASIVGYFASKPPKTTEYVNPNDRDSLWVCVARQETHDFKIRVGDLAKVNVLCPECGSEEVQRAHACPNCGRYYPVGRFNASPEHCTHCNARLPGADMSVFHAHEGH